MTATHIVLVGAMGSGKTTTGIQLAKATHRPFVDSDQQIEGVHGATGRKLAECKGVPWLHQAEATAFDNAIQSTEPAVIAAAASIADRDDLVAVLESTQLFVVLLEAEPQVLADRTRDGDHRRPFDWTDMSPRLRQRRERLAAVADVVISTTAADPDSVAAAVLAAYAEQR